MDLSKGIRRVLIAFLKDKVKVASWGITNICIEDTLLRFDVNGFKFSGNIQIKEASVGGYNIQLGNQKILDCRLEEITSILDSEIECGKDYISDLKKWIDDIKK